MNLRIQSQLDRLTSSEYQDDSLNAAIKGFKRDFNESFQSGADDIEVLHFLKVLETTLGDAEYLGSRDIPVKVIQDRIVKYIPASICKVPLCQSCKAVEELIDSFAKKYRS